MSQCFTSYQLQSFCLFFNHYKPSREGATICSSTESLVTLCAEEWPSPGQCRSEMTWAKRQSWSQQMMPLLVNSKGVHSEISQTVLPIPFCLFASSPIQSPPPSPATFCHPFHPCLSEFSLLLGWTLFTSLGSLFNTGKGCPWLPLIKIYQKCWWHTCFFRYHWDRGHLHTCFFGYDWDRGHSTPISLCSGQRTWHTCFFRHVLDRGHDTPVSHQDRGHDTPISLDMFWTGDMTHLFLIRTEGMTHLFFYTAVPDRGQYIPVSLGNCPRQKTVHTCLLDNYIFEITILETRHCKTFFFLICCGQRTQHTCFCCE